MTLRDVKPLGIAIYCIPGVWVGLWVSTIETFADAAFFISYGFTFGTVLLGACSWVVSKWFLYPVDEFVPPITK